MGQIRISVFVSLKTNALCSKIMALMTDTATEITRK